jgi:23S rRNA (adenine2503-C2)-methyltransferase
MKDSEKIRLKNISVTDMSGIMAGLGEPKFRKSQIIKWLYQKRVSSFDEMSNLSVKSRKSFSDNCVIDKLRLEKCIESKSRDAVKFGFLTADGKAVIESVLIRDDDRRTACISSQLGCGLGCVFCVTGSMGFIRDLSQEEIIGQIIGINDYCISKNDRIVTNVVFMGMGEALSNFDSFLSALKIIMHEDAFGIGARRITVSTAGVVPSIERLMDQNLTIGLAISLNTYSNAKRNAIMPVNRKYPIELLVDAAKRYENRTGRPVTFEYVLVDGENDSGEAVNSLVSFLRGVKCKINVIPVNPGGYADVKTPPEKKLYEFCEALVRAGVTATVRKSRGRDISGACGQLGGLVFGK